MSVIFILKSIGWFVIFILKSMKLRISKILLNVVLISDQTWLIPPASSCSSYEWDMQLLCRVQLINRLRQGCFICIVRASTRRLYQDVSLVSDPDSLLFVSAFFRESRGLLFFGNSFCFLCYSLFFFSFLFWIFMFTSLYYKFFIFIYIHIFAIKKMWTVSYKKE
jgi:hypothetical protein